MGTRAVAAWTRERGVASDVQRETRLANPCPGSKDYQVGALQAAKQPVEVAEVRVDAWEGARPDLGLGLKNLAEDIADMDEVVRVSVLAQTKEQLLSLIDSLVSVGRVAVAKAGLVAPTEALAEEVLGLEELLDAVERPPLDEERADNSLFSLDVVRR